MPIVNGIESLLHAGNRSSIFSSSCNDRQNLWWSAFRKIVLNQHNISVHENVVVEMVPQELLRLVETKYDNLDRHAEQAITFFDAVAAGQGFGPSPIFPPDVVPAVPDHCCLSRCLEATLSKEIIPPFRGPEDQCLFEMPQPRPNLASGFSESAFSQQELCELPEWSAACGCLADYGTGQVSPGLTVYLPFLLFERTYGTARHELECSANYCAMNGSAAVNAMQLLFDHAYAGQSPQPLQRPVLFTCILDNDLAVIHHHWISDEGTFSMAPLCKFDFRDLEHFMHFLAWIEAIEEWATKLLLPDVRNALGALAQERAAGIAVGAAKALSSPVTDAEKQEKLSHSMKMAFENIPWKGERFRKTPLGATMRMRVSRPVGESGPVSPPPEASNLQNVPEQNGQSISLTNNAQSPALATPDTVVAASPPPTAPLGLATPSPPNDNFSKSLPNSPATKTDKKRRIPAAILSIKSATLPRSSTTSPTQRSATNAEPQTASTINTVASSQTVPIPRPESATSSAIVESTVEMKSPAKSIISISSKKSFRSLRSGKSIRSPGTPDSNANVSPRGTSFKSKISNSLDAIKERTSAKRSRASDNSAPSSAKEGPLPTPAYDKKRFEIRPPQAPVPLTPKFWSQQVLQAGSDNNSATAAAYNASHVLPFRQYAKSPTFATITTTITAGGGN